jgi:hypothetical protein
MLNRKQLPCVGYLKNQSIHVNTVVDHLRQNNLLDWSRYTDINYSANSRHQSFVVANEFCKDNFFKEEEAPNMEGELYRQLYLTDFDTAKTSGKVELHNTNIFERSKRLDPASDRYLAEADELNYGVRNNLVTGILEEILDSFESKITRVRLAYLSPNFGIKPHVDYDPTYIVRYHIPLITNPGVVMGFERQQNTQEYHLPADGKIYFFNSGIKHWVNNHSNQGRLHLIVDVHGQNELSSLVSLPEQNHHCS